MNLLHLEGESLYIKGATKIISSSQTQAVIQTGESMVVLTGNNIEVKKLNLEEGEVCLNGNFSNIKLNEHSSKKQPLLKRIFK